MRCVLSSRWPYTPWPPAPGPWPLPSQSTPDILASADQRLCAVAAVAGRLKRNIQLLGQRQARQGKTHPLRFGQGNAHVLEKCSTKKPGAKLLAMIRGPRFESDQLPAAPEATDCITFPGPSRPVGIEQRLADADHVRGDQDLVDHLGVLTGTGTALANDRLAHRLPAGPQRATTSGSPPP